MHSSRHSPQSKQEIHRRSARLRNTKYKSAPAAEKKVSTKGKGRRHIFKLKNVMRAWQSAGAAGGSGACAGLGGHGARGRSGKSSRSWELSARFSTQKPGDENVSSVPLSFEVIMFVCCLKGRKISLKFTVDLF